MHAPVRQNEKAGCTGYEVWLVWLWPIDLRLIDSKAAACAFFNCSFRRLNSLSCVDIEIELADKNSICS